MDFKKNGWINLDGCDLDLCLDADDLNDYLFENGFNGFYEEDCGYYDNSIWNEDECRWVYADEFEEYQDYVDYVEKYLQEHDEEDLED